ncbi:MAG TPA: DUF3231 family protein [Firmicutes bacterium]|nr:DUF3231 family protein [Bacillota bacterium]
MVKTASKQVINCQEAFGIWDLLSAKYHFLEKLHIWQNYIHDTALKVLLNGIENTLQKLVTQLEECAKAFSISAPEVGVINVKTSSNTEIIRDELIAQDIFIGLQGIAELVLRTLRTNTTNDKLRTTIIRINSHNLQMMDGMVSYMRMMGRIDTPSIYPNIPKTTKEKIDLSKVSHLWDHLTFRYDNIHQTEIFKDLVSDKDLKLLITAGLQAVLKKQVLKLEEECLKFGSPLPKRPPNVIAIPADVKRFLQDDHIYRTILTGITGATSIHVAAVKQCLTNDRIRKFFIELLQSEITIHNELIKYGKTKGYLNEPPQYNFGLF